jgi:hypothetical protein
MLNMPLDLFEQVKVQAIKEAECDLKASFLAEVITPEDQLILAHPDFNVAVVTRFARDEYEEFLRGEVPLELMQPILVTVKR